MMNSGRNQSASTDVEYALLAWVKASERKRAILHELSDSPQNSSYFAEQWNTSTEAVNYHLNQLCNGGPEGEWEPLIQVLTPSRRQYRLYGLTESGKAVISWI